MTFMQRIQKPQDLPDPVFSAFRLPLFIRQFH